MGQWLKSKQIAYRLAIAFGVCLLLAMIVAGYGVQGLNAVDSGIVQLQSKDLPSIAQAGQFAYNASISRTIQFRVAGLPRPQALKLVDLQAKYEHQADEALVNYEKLIQDEQERKDYEDLKAIWGQYKSDWAQNRDRVLAMTPEQGIVETERFTKPVFLPKVMPALEKLTKYDADRAANRSKAAHVAADKAKGVVVIVLMVAVGIGALMGRFITKTITQPVAEINERLVKLRDEDISHLADGLNAFAKSDLRLSVEAQTQPVTNIAKDEIGQMSQTFNGMLAKLHEAMDSYTAARSSLTHLVSEVTDEASRVSETSETLAATSQQSTSASNEIAAGSERLAKDSTAAASIVEDLFNQVKTVGESSKSQNALIAESTTSLELATSGIENVATASDAMARVAQEGNFAVTETAHAMELVREQVGVSSAQIEQLDEMGQKIGSIVQTIAGIAEQTNLLALNAAIEAARAGEQGRGFAVVADEVRKLAEQSSGATREISELIGTVRSTVSATVTAIRATEEQVENGSAKSAQAGVALEQIVEAVAGVSERSNEVSRIAAKVSQGFDRLAKMAVSNEEAAAQMELASDRVAQVIQSVAAVSQQSAAGAQELCAGVQEVGIAAGQLSQMSRDLTGLVQTFKLDKATEKSYLKAA